MSKHTISWLRGQEEQCSGPVTLSMGIILPPVDKLTLWSLWMFYTQTMEEAESQRNCWNLELTQEERRKPVSKMPGETLCFLFLLMGWGVDSPPVSPCERALLVDTPGRDGGNEALRPPPGCSSPCFPNYRHSLVLWGHAGSGQQKDGLQIPEPAFTNRAWKGGKEGWSWPWTQGVITQWEKATWKQQEVKDMFSAELLGNRWGRNLPQRQRVQTTVPTPSCSRHCVCTADVRGTSEDQSGPTRPSCSFSWTERETGFFLTFLFLLTSDDLQKKKASYQFCDPGMSFWRTQGPSHWNVIVWEDGDPITLVSVGNRRHLAPSCTVTSYQEDRRKLTCPLGKADQQTQKAYNPHPSS